MPELLALRDVVHCGIRWRVDVSTMEVAEDVRYCMVTFVAQDTPGCWVGVDYDDRTGDWWAAASWGAGDDIYDQEISTEGTSPLRAMREAALFLREAKREAARDFEADQQEGGIAQ